MDINEIRTFLNNNAEEKYQKFSSALLPNIDNILGVRLPKLRKFAKTLITSSYKEEFLNIKNPLSMEELMLQGIVIGIQKETTTEKLLKIKQFIPKINCWSICDSFCSGLKFTISNKDLVWEFLQPYFNSTKEYELRFAYVMALNYYINKQYLPIIFKHINTNSTKDYYAQMAIAWFLSIAYIKEKEITLEYLKTTKINTWIFNKAIQKCIESNQIPKQEKDFLKKLKK